MPNEKKKKRSATNSNNASISVGGNVNGSNLIVGNNNVVTQNNINITAAFDPIYRAVEDHPSLSSSAKEDVKAELQDVEAEIKKGEQVDEGGMMRHLRNVQRMAPDILDVVLATFANPVAGLGMVASKIAKKWADEAGK